MRDPEQSIRPASTLQGLPPQSMYPRLAAVEVVAETVRIVRIVRIRAERKSFQGIGRSSPRTLDSSADDHADEG
jgi:hypothetical protein